MMYAFHMVLYPRPDHGLSQRSASLEGHTVSTLVGEPAAFAHLFRLSFEQAVAALGALPRLFCEPDGAFVWASPFNEPAWQVDGMLYDRAERLWYVELRGRCPPAAFDRLLAAFGWPETGVMMQLVRHGVMMSETEFRQIAQNAPAILV